MSRVSLARVGRKRSVIDLARTSTDPDERADFFEREAGCRQARVAIRTNRGRDEDRRECLAQIRNSGKADGV